MLARELELDGRYQRTFSNGTIHAFDETGKNITANENFLKRLDEFNSILDPGLVHYAKERDKSSLPDISVRKAFEHLGWVPSSPMDNVIEWNGFDLDEYATTPEHTSLSFTIILTPRILILVTQTR